jgi:hypothetical protein
MQSRSSRVVGDVVAALAVELGDRHAWAVPRCDFCGRPCRSGDRSGPRRRGRADVAGRGRVQRRGARLPVARPPEGSG